MVDRSFSSHRLASVASLLPVLVATAWTTGLPAVADFTIVETTSVVSVGPDGVSGQRSSFEPSVSGDGRFVAFTARSRLVRGDFNGATDIFVRDQASGVTELVSVRADGIGANGDSEQPSISPDGRYVAFASRASNLVPMDTNGCPDIFVRDRLQATIERVSVNDQGVQGDNCSYYPAISADGRYVAFLSLARNLVAMDRNRTYDIFVRDRLTRTTERVAVDPTRGGWVDDLTPWGNLDISADGRFIAFLSADEIEPGDSNGVADVVVHDRLLGTTELVSVASDGRAADRPSHEPDMSADGRYVVFHSRASTLVPGDTNGRADVFVRDRQSCTTTRVSVRTDGSPVTHGGRSGVISDDGRYVAFVSHASTLIPGDTNQVADVFLRDLELASTRRVSVSTAGAQSNKASASPAISSDGFSVAFASEATNLATEDSSEATDVFVHRSELDTASNGHLARMPALGTGSEAAVRTAPATSMTVVPTAGAHTTGLASGARLGAPADILAGLTTRVSLSDSDQQVANGSWAPDLSGNGRYVAFISRASALVPGDTNLLDDVFVRDRLLGSTERVSVSSDGIEGYLELKSPAPRISGDGRYVAFASRAWNLVPGDSNERPDVFVRDRLSGTTERVSLTSGERQGYRSSEGPVDISADGRFVVFESWAKLSHADNSPTRDVYVRDRVAGTTELVSVNDRGVGADKPSYDASISADGRYITFTSRAKTFVAADYTGPARVPQIFVRDRITKTTKLISVNSRGKSGNWYSEHPAISGNGRFVAFISSATNLSPDSPEDLSLQSVYLRDRRTDRTELVHASDYDAAISADGRYVAFTGSSRGPGRRPPDRVFVWDRLTEETLLASVDSQGVAANNDSRALSLSANGRTVAFASGASNLVPDDTNKRWDIFVRGQSAV